MISQPTVPAVEPIGNDPNARMVPQSRDADLELTARLFPHSVQTQSKSSRTRSAWYRGRRASASFHRSNGSPKSNPGTLNCRIGPRREWMPHSSASR